MVQKTAIIFGGGGGIGSSLAEKLHAEGWKLAIVGRTAEKLDAVVATTGAYAIIADATVSADVDRAVAEAQRQLGGLGAVVHCVGSILLKPAHLTSDAEWHDVMNLNLHSAFYVLRAGVKALRKDGGSLAFCSSAAAVNGIPSHEAIAAAKGALISMVRSAAATYAANKVRVNAVAPGLVRTPMAARITGNEASLKASTAMHPLGRIGEPEDVASALAWLIDPAQGWVTGQTIGVDGGLTLKGHSA